jgi:hypothetical protein
MTAGEDLLPPHIRLANQEKWRWPTPLLLNTCPCGLIKLDVAHLRQNHSVTRVKVQLDDSLRASKRFGGAEHHLISLGGWNDVIASYLSRKRGAPNNSRVVR